MRSAKVHSHRKNHARHHLTRCHCLVSGHQHLRCPVAVDTTRHTRHSRRLILLWVHPLLLDAHLLRHTVHLLELDSYRSTVAVLHQLLRQQHLIMVSCFKNPPPPSPWKPAKKTTCSVLCNWWRCWLIAWELLSSRLYNLLGQSVEKDSS